MLPEKANFLRICLRSVLDHVEFYQHLTAVVGRKGQKVLRRAPLVFTVAFASRICFNYVVQTTFLPVLATRTNVKA
jgi:hypothetical protein